MQHAPHLPVVIATRETAWIGLVGVSPGPGSTTLVGAVGAYVTAVARVEDRNAFEAAVAAALSVLDLAPFEFEDVEPISERVSNWEIDEALLGLAKEVESFGGVRFGTFHNFRKTN